MKLLLLNYEFPPLGGGASSATFHMAIELARRGHHVDVLTSSAEGTPAEEVIDGARIYRVASWRRGVHDAGLIGAATYLLSAAPRLRKLTRVTRYDCAHSARARQPGSRVRAGLGPERHVTIHGQTGTHEEFLLAIAD